MRIAFYISAITVICSKALISALLSVLSCVIKCHYGAICWVVFKQNVSDCSETSPDYFCKACPWAQSEWFHLTIPSLYVWGLFD